MCMLRGCRGERRHDGAADGGHTLVELIVAMSIFTVVLAVIVATVLEMSTDVRKTENLTAASGAARAAYSRFDKQVRYADAINSPGQNGNDWYVEFETVGRERTTGGSPAPRSCSPCC